MPELPDITVYVEALERRVVGETLRELIIRSPFVLRSVDPAPEALAGSAIRSVRRMGKRIVLGVEARRFIVIHLMVAGRLRWIPRGKKSPGKIVLAELDLGGARVALTEASKKKRASVHLVAGEDALRDFERGGLNVVTASTAEFQARLQSASHTLKRALTDPRLFDGIGNAYSDEILHRARLSPLTLTGRVSDSDVAHLHRACVDILTEWTERLRVETGTSWPEHVTAFRPEMAVHGKYRLPCPVCGTPVQRIRYAENETNYCPECQTGGRLLADRALSRLLRKDWPRSIDEYDGMIERGRELGTLS
jgi:formamidopyrimidine-DNA glycosylase